MALLSFPPNVITAPKVPVVLGRVRDSEGIHVGKNDDQDQIGHCIFSTLSLYSFRFMDAFTNSLTRGGGGGVGGVRGGWVGGWGGIVYLILVLPVLS